MVQRVLFNKLDKPENRTFADLSRRECVVLGPLVALMIWIGVHPAPFLRRMEPSVQVVLERVEEARTVLFDGASDPGAGLAPRPAGEEE